MTAPKKKSGSCQQRKEEWIQDGKSRRHPPESVPSPQCCAKLLQLCLTLCNPGSSVKRFSRQEYWSGCHALLQGIFPTQGSNSSLMSPALAGGFFTTSTPWEALLPSNWILIWVRQMVVSTFPSPSHRLLLELKHSDIGPFSVSLRPLVAPSFLWSWYNCPEGHLGSEHHFNRPLISLHIICMWNSEGRSTVGFVYNWLPCLYGQVETSKFGDVAS